jgi:flagellar hook-associated protein 2
LGISFGSINTGLPKDIVKQLVEAEKIPIRKMEGRKGKINSKKELVGDLVKRMEDMRGLLNANSDDRSLKELSSSFDEKIVGVTMDKNVAKPGSHQIEVVQLAQKSSAMTSGFESKDESYIGVGYIQYQLPNGDTKEIYVDPNNASLEGVARLINNTPDAGMSANVIDDGTGEDAPFRLIISLEGGGDNNKAEFPYMYFVDGDNDFFLEKERAAQDAIIKVDGFEVQLPENKAKDIIQGVTIDLKKAVPGEEFTLSVTEDIQKISEKVQGIVDKINSVFSFIKEQNTLDENSDTSRTLGGDFILQTIESRLRAAMFKNILTEEGYKRAGDIGITFQRDGLIALDAKKFDNELSSNYNVVSQVLTGYATAEAGNNPGFVDNLKEMVTSTLRSPSGILRSRQRSLKNSIGQIDRRIQQKQRNIETKEKNLKNKFARLEGTISQIQNQGAGIAALGAQTNPVTQLG